MPETIAGRYALLTNLGAGGSADVWQARDTVLQRDVAIKRYSPGHEVTSAVSREMGALSALDHPGIVRLFDAGIQGDRPYLVVELVSGPTLRERLRAGPLPPRHVRTIGRDIAEALAHAHERGLVHQDVTPSNILLEDGRARLTDFGVSGPPQAATPPEGVATTSGYTAVEQLLGGPVSPAADVHALGLVLLEALTGHKEFDGPPLCAAVARIRRQPVIPPDLPEPWPQLLCAMTVREPEKRPTAATVAAYLGTDSMDLPPLEVAAPVAHPGPAEVKELALAGFVKHHPRIAVTIASVLVGLAMAPLYHRVSSPPQATVMPGVVASEIPPGSQGP